MKTTFFATIATLALLNAPVRAEEPSPVAQAIEEYMEFAEYGAGVIGPEQIPAEDWKRILVIDARDAGQFAADHIPGAVNIDWRATVARRDEIPRDGLVVVYCNTGSLSAQAVFALRLLGWDNVRVLQDGIAGWKAKGGFEANRRAAGAAAAH